MKHYDDFKNWGFEVYSTTPREIREQRAITTQMNDKTFNDAGADYQQKIIEYGIANHLLLRLPIPQPEKITPKLPQLK